MRIAPVTAALGTVGLAAVAVTIGIAANVGNAGVPTGAKAARAVVTAPRSVALARGPVVTASTSVAPASTSVAPASTSVAPAARSVALAPQPTARVVIRAVHADGTPVQGYRVSTDDTMPVTCGGASVVAVNDGIAFCAPTAMNTMACWKSIGSTALCLRDAFAHELVRVTYQGAFPPTQRLGQVVPQDLVLAGGQVCRIRDGGAWDMLRSHAGWYGSYTCGDGPVYGLVYGPQQDNGIDTATLPWTVHLVTGIGTSAEQVRDVRVQTAYYVGTAG